MKKIYNVDVSWSGYMRGTARYTVIAESEEEAKELVECGEGEVGFKHVIRDDTTREVLGATYIQEF